MLNNNNKGLDIAKCQSGISRHILSAFAKAWHFIIDVFKEMLKCCLLIYMDNIKGNVKNKYVDDEEEAEERGPFTQSKSSWAS